MATRLNVLLVVEAAFLVFEPRPEVLRPAPVFEPAVRVAVRPPRFFFEVRDFDFAADAERPLAAVFRPLLFVFDPLLRAAMCIPLFASRECNKTRSGSQSQLRRAWGVPPFGGGALFGCLLEKAGARH